MQPRYFIGTTLPDDLMSKIEKIQDKLLSGHKVMEPLVPHITLLHPNILMTLSPLYFIPKVKAISQDALPIDVELVKTALFDKRVLHITVKSPGVVKLQKELVGLLPDDIRARYEIGREYTPHVTLVQAKPLQELPEGLIEQFKREIEPSLPVKFRVEELNQFTWLRPRIYQVKPI